MDGDTSICSESVDTIATEDSRRTVSRVSSSGTRIEVVCLVGEARSDAELVSILKNRYRVEVVESENGTEYKDAKCVFVCSDFNGSAAFMYLHAAEKLIIGPALVKLRYSLAKPLVMPRANRPLYTESMATVRIALSGLSNRQCREAVDLIHYMGGSARKDFLTSTTHLITEAASGKTYRMAISMGVRAMHLEWLRAAWKFRNDISASVTSVEFMNPYMVEPFCGLSLWFVAFSDEDYQDMRQKTLEHKGRTASSQQDATHIVVSNAPEACVDDVDPRQHLVSAEWFWLSIQLNCCGNEELYQWKGQPRISRKRMALSPMQNEHTPSRPARRTLSRSSLDNLENSNSSTLPDYSEHMASADDLEKHIDSPRKVDKRLAVCRELLETEENYLRAIKIIVQSFKEPLEQQADNPESGLLSKCEIAQIFSRVPPLIELHEKICNDLRSYVLHWMPDRLIGKVYTIWLEGTPRILPLYRAFLNSYDVARDLLKEYDQTRPKFHAFIKATESRAECQRHQLKDLMARPMQRLPSVLLLLKTLLSKTERSNPDYAYVSKAARSLDAILSNVNESRRQTESYEKVFRIANEIENIPSLLVSSARTVQAELHVLSLGGEDEWAKTRGRKMGIFLFNDLIEIVKIRPLPCPNDSDSNQANETLSLQISFSSLRVDKKKYKHYQYYPLTSIRQIDLISHHDVDGVFMISFRVSEGEVFWVAQCIDCKQTNDLRTFATAMSGQIYSLCGRNTLMPETRFDLDSLCLGSRETIATVDKALQYAIRKGSSLPFVRPPSGFRRAMSTVSLGISQTLSRFHSRAHLAAINESMSSDGSVTIGPVATPHRGLRQMLSSNTFIPTRLSLARRDSSRSSSTQDDSTTFSNTTLA